METRKEIKVFGKELLKLRQQLQDGRLVSRKEYDLLKSDLQSLMLDLEMNRRRGRSKVAVTHR
jgi:hypothetical protein